MINYLIGVEREGLRCDNNGILSKLPHPEIFGNRMNNRFISTDFGESQLELRTLPYSSVDECYEKLYEITNAAMRELYLNGETLWYYSLPCALPENRDFIFNDYTGYPGEAEYEHYLVQKYGYRMHQMSAVHIGFSIDDTIDRLRIMYPHIPADKNEAYMRLMQNYIKKRWFAVCFLGATPLSENGKKVAAFSLKALDSGFDNGSIKWVDFSDFHHYIDSIDQKIKNGTLYRYDELYIPIRARTTFRSDECKTELEVLEKNGIEYVEIRMGEINPFNICGVSKAQLSLMTAFMFSCLTDTEAVEIDYKEISKNGLTDETRLFIADELQNCKKINELLELGLDDDLTEIQKDFDNDKLVAQQIERISKNDFSEFVLERSKKYARDAFERIGRIKKYPHLEKSTVCIIKDGLIRGIDYRIVDEAHSIVEFSDSKKKEYIVQATKTKNDSYIFPYITDDKVLAKEIMIENGICTPGYIHFSQKEYERDAEKLFQKLNRCPVVIKPKSTNCGVGITILDKHFDEAEINKAIREALRYDCEIIMEYYKKGPCYRFFMINGKCESVIRYVNANVVGDGIHTIKQLLDLKQNDYWFRAFEIDIQITEATISNLSEIGMTLDSVPVKGEVVFLHKMSKSFWGGESVACTDTMPERFKIVAEKTAKCFEASICGVDMLIADTDKEEYYVLEINDNPGLYGSEHPRNGLGVRLGIKILESVGLDIG